MNFIKVQIPYRGVIPIINKRGPLSCVELDSETVKKLQEYGAELLNPETGRPLGMVMDTPVEAENEPVKIEEKVSIIESEPEAKPDEEPPIVASLTEEEKTAVENVASEVAEVTAATPIFEPEVNPDPVKEEGPTEEAAIEAKSAESEEPEVASLENFEYIRIKNYSSLAKSKKREIRAAYVELSKTITDKNILYAKLNELAIKTEG